MYFDTHVNLHAEAFADDLDDVLARARTAGVSRMLAICDKMENAAAVLAIAEANPDIWASVGAHPHYARGHQDLTAERLIEAAQNPKVVAIGETGLDRHYEYSPIEEQIPVFRAHIAAARETGLPLIVHTRNADSETAQMLTDEMEKGAFRFVLHCFTAGLELARTGLALGGYLSASGIITFRNAHDVRAVFEAAPLDRIIIETDCPYLAPVPMRGRRNEPEYVLHVARYLADLKGVSPDVFNKVIQNNSLTLFDKVI